MVIPGLKNALVKMLYQYNLQVSVQEGCQKILVSDYFNLLKKLVKTQQKGSFYDLIWFELLKKICFKGYRWLKKPFAGLVIDRW